MTSVANEFFPNVQLARKKIFKRYLIWFLCFFAGVAVQQLVHPFPGFILMAGVLVCGIALLWSPIRRLQKMPCPYCHYPARVGIFRFRHLRCLHCHRSIGADTRTNRKA